MKSGNIGACGVNLDEGIGQYPQPDSFLKTGVVRRAQMLLMMVAFDAIEQPPQRTVKISIELYSDAIDALCKAMLE